MSDGQRTAGVWDRRVDSWHEHVMSGPVFDHIRGKVLQVVALRKEDHCVDLGAGTGFLALELAERSRSVLAVDIASLMLPPDSVDVAGSNSERPASPAFFLRAARDAGFVSVRYEHVEAEAGLLTAVQGPRP